jgi:hypothetical protein
MEGMTRAWNKSSWIHKTSITRWFNNYGIQTILLYGLLGIVKKIDYLRRLAYEESA